MRGLRYYSALILLTACTSAPVKQSADICAEPTVIAHAKGSCRTYDVVFRANEKVEAATLASVVTELIRDYDVMYPAVRYFLREPDGRLVDLGAFRPARGAGALEVYEQLGYRLASAGGLVRTNPDDFYERLLERSDGKYCVVYRMKHPLVGELKDCDGAAKPSGSVGYAAGVVTWLEAVRRVCLLRYLERQCRDGPGGVETNAIRRDSNGRMYYLIASTYLLRSYPDRKIDGEGPVSIPGDSDRSTYHLDAESGSLELIKQETVYCDGRTCVTTATRLNKPESPNSITPSRTKPDFPGL